jgi:hypothetical protein
MAGNNIVAFDMRHRSTMAPGGNPGREHIKSHKHEMPAGKADAVIEPTGAYPILTVDFKIELVHARDSDSMFHSGAIGHSTHRR